ncbi:MAG: hypothetical protein ACE5QV_01990, partial [Fidelibacterota bacterium]
MRHKSILSLLIGIFLFFLPQLNTTFPLDIKDDCLSCHGDKELLEDLIEEDPGRYLISSADITSSVHSELSCGSCHEGISDYPHPEIPPSVQCGSCHADVENEYKTSVHGIAGERHIEEAPKCQDCHGKHDVKRSTERSSHTNRVNLPITCAKCHADPEIIKKYEIPIPTVFKMYEESVHGKALIERGVSMAPTCSDCHGIHDLKPSTDPSSKIFRLNIARTC